MPRRIVSILIGVALAIPIAVVAPTIVSHDPADADGFNFLCDAPGAAPGDPSEFEQLANGMATKILTDQALWVFKGTVPPGVPVTVPGAVTDPVTLETSFAIPIAPKLGNSQKLDFIATGAIPGAEGDEIRFGYKFRLKAGQRADDLSMKELFQENYGLTPDPGNDFDVLGIDIEFETNQAIGNMQGFRGEFGAFFQIKLADGTTQNAASRFNIDSTRLGARIPEEATLSLVTRKQTDPGPSFVAFGQRAIQAEFTGAANQSGAGFGIELDRVDAAFVADPFIAMHLDWTAAPRGVAVGIGSFCPDKGHIAWNHTGLPTPAAGAVGIDVQYGIEEGLDTMVDLGAGPVPRKANMADVTGTINGLPERMDVILLRDALSFTRSADVAPDIDLTRLAMADDDPADPDDLPLYATAKATDIPRHLLLTADITPAGVFERGEFTSWTLQCPGEPTPAGPAAPTELRRLALTQTLPGFPAGCTRYNLTPVPSAQAVVQNWLPEDLNGQAAAAGLAPPPLTANQFGYFATRDKHAMSADALLAFGGKINGLQRATFDLTGAVTDGEKARVYVERVPVVAADDSIRVVGDIDGRTSTNELTNTGARFTTAATITDLPDRIRVDYETTPTSPLTLTWRASSPIAVTDGTFDAQLKGPDAIVIHGAFETGAVGAGALPPAATLRIDEDADKTGGSVRWFAPGAVTDTFPTPTVPAYDPATVTRVHAGAQISTAAERTFSLQTQVHANIDVPQPVNVTWDTQADGKLNSLVAAFCDPAVPAGCAATRFDGTARKGVQALLTPAQLLTPPALPAPSTDINNAVAPFTNFRPTGSGARAVILGAHNWGADAVITGVARAEYKRVPTEVTVQLAGTTPQPFRVNLLDASTTKLVDGVNRPQILFADALLSDLPHEMRVRYDNADPNQPLVWLNTESLAITNINDVNFASTDPPGTRPTLTGIARAGDAGALAAVLKADDRPTADRTAANKGVDIWGEFDQKNELFSLDASIALDIPRHVAVFKPVDSKCEVSSPPVDISECQGHPVYDIDQTTDLALTVKTTAPSFGDLELNGGITGTTKTNETFSFLAHATVENIAGTLEGAVQITANRRLPWQTYKATLEGNAELGDVVIDVIDRMFDFDPATAGIQRVAYRRAPSDTQATSNYAVSLANVPSGLDVTARLQAFEPRLHGLPGEKPSSDPCSPKRDEDLPGPNLGFVHGSLDLGSYGDGETAELQINAREVDGNFAARFSSEKPVTGFVNGLAQNVKLKINANCDPVTGFDQFIVTGIGIAAIGVGAAIGSVGGPIGAIIGGVVGAIVGALLDLFSEAEVTVDFELDADLPFFLSFDETTDIRVGLASLTLSADEKSSGGGPAQVGFRQQSMPNETAFTADGGFFHSRRTRYIGDDIPGIDEDWNASNDLLNTRADIGLLPWHDCNNYDTDDPCPTNGVLNVAGVNQFPVTARDAGYQSTDILVDILFNSGNRSHLADADGGLADPGLELFPKLAQAGKPFEVGAFDFSDLPVPSTTTDDATFEFNSVCCADVTFTNNFQNPPTSTFQDFGSVCGLSTKAGVVAGPRARGSDGTEYVVMRVADTTVPVGAARTFCENTKLVLQASLPQSDPALADERLGPIRWSVSLPVPSGIDDPDVCAEEVFDLSTFEIQGVRCDISIAVNPQSDGSVQVVIDSTAVENGVDGGSLNYELFLPFPDANAARIACCPEPELRDGGDQTELPTRRAWVDSSGHPGFFEDNDALVSSFTATTSGVTPGADGNVDINTCTLASWTCGSGPGANQRTRVVFGDGVVTDSLTGAPGVLHHQYPITAGTDTFLGLVVRLGPSCEDTEPDQPAIGSDCKVLDKVYFRVTT